MNSWMVIFFVGLAGSTFGDHRGQEFIFAFLGNPGDINSLYISSWEGCEVDISVEHTAFTSLLEIDPASHHVVNLDTSLQYDGGDTFSVQRKAVHIRSTQNISIYVSMEGTTQGDGFLVFPVSTLGRHYIAVSGDVEAGHSHLVVVGTENDTSITIDLVLQSGECTVNSHISGHSLTVTIRHLDVIGVECTGDLTGTVVTSNKPIAVLSGNDLSSFPPSSPTSDMVVEMLIPVHIFGLQYIVIPLPTSDSSTTYKVVASQNDTTLNVNGAVLTNLNSSEFYDLVPVVESVLESSSPVLVVVFDSMKAGAKHGVFMAVVPPTNRFIVNPLYEYKNIGGGSKSQTYISIFYNSTRYPGMTFDNPNLIVSISGSDFSFFTTLASDVQETDFEAQVNEVGYIVYALAKDAAYGYVGGIDLTLDPCFSSPCLNMGTCSVLGGEVTCQCQIGFTGPYCQTEIVETTSLFQDTVMEQSSQMVSDVYSDIIPTPFSTGLDIYSSMYASVISPHFSESQYFVDSTATIVHTSVDTIGSIVSIDGSSVFAPSTESEYQSSQTIQSSSDISQDSSDILHGSLDILHYSSTILLDTVDIFQRTSSGIHHYSSNILQDPSDTFQVFSSDIIHSSSDVLQDSSHILRRSFSDILHSSSDILHDLSDIFQGSFSDILHSSSDILHDLSDISQGSFSAILNSSPDSSKDLSDIFQGSSSSVSQFYLADEITIWSATNSLSTTNDVQSPMLHTNRGYGACDDIDPTVSNMCLCTTYLIPTSFKITEKLKKEIRKTFQKKLLVDTRNLTKTIYRYTSVPDNRPSARTVGAVGIVALLLVVAVVVLPDLVMGLKNLMGNRYGNHKIIEVKGRSET